MGIRYYLLCYSIGECFVVPAGTPRDEWAAKSVWQGSDLAEGDRVMAGRNGWPLVLCPGCAGVSTGCFRCGYSGKMSVVRAEKYEKMRRANNG